MQVFRLMSLPDKVIAFDSLPDRLLSGIELCRAEGFPRHWKEFLGRIEKKIPIPPEKDLLTGQVRYFDPIIDNDAFFYLIDQSINQSSDRWKEICDFVRRVVPKDFRLLDKIDDMALPLAANKTDGVTLEPEDVVIIPIPLEFQEKAPKLVNKNGSEIKKEENLNALKCTEPGCKSEFEGAYARNSLRMHTLKKHKEKVVA